MLHEAEPAQKGGRFHLRGAGGVGDAVSAEDTLDRQEALAGRRAFFPGESGGNIGAADGQGEWSGGAAGECGVRWIAGKRGGEGEW